MSSGLESIGAWAWQRYQEEIQVVQEEVDPLYRYMAEGKADAFQEMAKYIDTVQQAREDHGQTA